MASVGPYASHLNLAPDRQARQHLIAQVFTDWMLFLPPILQSPRLKALKAIPQYKTIAVKFRIPLATNIVQNLIFRMTYASAVT